mmetsp:Transcript_74207/g.117456  ORF Transcript_74207/g.117456 Transcript_74207/m.117456 type:complete len:438 (-) Transcript_74207:158-1471(-)|eukprot:CAMPEP_0169102574 /NCGR_PEP_ID=MMETSP1015-20121227/22241_1 /TAXON_ID=342587 /ORGANISM="Karlodinium micrum, Strain CCMP2283" /LENGTH=437 /DNA_ID=CAMNT_0009163687 /DNA_START=68 /DNA_END=1381 /DNA_ORIENTATION=+
MTDRKARCVVHGKLRSIDCLVETGAGLVCSSRTQCKDGGGDKDQPCRFFAIGKCDRGEDCLYRHDVEDAPVASTGKLRSPAAAKDRDLRDGCKGKGGKSPWQGVLGKSAVDPWLGNEGYGCAADPWGGFTDSWGKGKGTGAWDLRWSVDPWADDWGYWDGCGCMGKMGKGMVKDDMMCWKGIGPVKGKSRSKGDDYGKSRPKIEDYGKSRPNGDDIILDERKETCSEHGKLRSIDCLEDAGDGTLICKLGFECQNAGEGGVKRAFCKFFAQGACERGLSCAFAHSDWEIGAPVEAPSLAAPPDMGKSRGKSKGKMWGGAFAIDGDEGRAICIEHGKQRSTTCMVASPDGWRCKPGKECQSASDGPKRAMCKFFLGGKCDRGDACVFAHDESEIGQMNPMAEELEWEEEIVESNEGGDDDEGEYGRSYDGRRGRSKPY